MALAGWLIGIVGLLTGLACILRLRAWEQQLRGARIAIAYKQRVKLQAPLTDYLVWANMLGKDQQSSGRVIYKMGGTSVAILKPRPDHGKTKTQVVTPVTRNK